MSAKVETYQVVDTRLFRNVQAAKDDVAVEIKSRYPGRVCLFRVTVKGLSISCDDLYFHITEVEA